MPVPSLCSVNNKPQYTNRKGESKMRKCCTVKDSFKLKIEELKESVLGLDIWEFTGNRL